MYLTTTQLTYTNFNPEHFHSNSTQLNSSLLNSNRLKDECWCKSKSKLSLSIHTFNMFQKIFRQSFKNPHFPLWFGFFIMTLFLWSLQMMIFIKHIIALICVSLLIIVLFLTLTPPELVIGPKRLRHGYLVDGITSKSDQLWMEEQKRRQEAVQAFCSKYGQEAKRKFNPGHFLLKINEKRHCLVKCFIINNIVVVWV